MYRYRDSPPRPYLQKPEVRDLAIPAPLRKPAVKQKAPKRQTEALTAEEIKAWAEQHFRDPPGAGKQRMKVILLEEAEHESRHGTYLDYLAHKRRGEDPCPPAVAAYNRARDQEAARAHRTA